MHTNINVVILTYKPDEKFFKLMKMLEKQTMPVNKVIVMNTDETYFPSQRFSSEFEDSRGIIVKHIDKKNFDHGNTRNEGASYADNDCEILIFMTMDAVPYDERLIENIVRPFENERVAASYARQVTDDKSSIMEQFTRSFNYPDKPHIKSLEDIEKLGIKAFFCSNVCCAYRLDVFKKLGGFVKRAIFNEDMVYANSLLKAGYLIAYASDAKVIHTHEYDGKAQFKRNFDLAVSQEMHPEVFKGISSEKEGIKYITEAFKYFSRNGRPFVIIPFGINCIYKYAGYRLGRKYDRLPYRKILKYSANPDFFDEN